jgi:hypothetical protein
MCLVNYQVVGYPEVIPFTSDSGRVHFVSSRGLLPKPSLFTRAVKACRR